MGLGSGEGEDLATAKSWVASRSLAPQCSWRASGMHTGVAHCSREQERHAAGSENSVGEHCLRRQPPHDCPLPCAERCAFSSPLRMTLTAENSGSSMQTSG